MFENIVKNKIRKISKLLTIADNKISLSAILANEQLSRAYKSFFSAEVEWWIWQEQILRSNNRYFEIGSDSFADINQELNHIYRDSAIFSDDILQETIEAAVRTRLNFLVRPRNTVKWFIFSGNTAKPSGQIVRKLQYLDDYKYLTEALENKYLLIDNQVTVTEFSRNVDAIDNENIYQMSSDTFINLTEPIFEFFDNKTEEASDYLIPTEAMIIFLDDKGMFPMARALESMMKEEGVSYLSQADLNDLFVSVLSQIESANNIPQESVLDSVKDFVNAESDSIENDEQQSAEKGLDDIISSLGQDVTVPDINLDDYKQDDITAENAFSENSEELSINENSETNETINTNDDSENFDFSSIVDKLESEIHAVRNKYGLDEKDEDISISGDVNDQDTDKIELDEENIINNDIPNEGSNEEQVSDFDISSIDDDFVNENPESDIFMDGENEDSDIITDDNPENSDDSEYEEAINEENNIVEDNEKTDKNEEEDIEKLLNDAGFGENQDKNNYDDLSLEELAGISAPDEKQADSTNEVKESTDDIARELGRSLSSFLNIDPDEMESYQPEPSGQNNDFEENTSKTNEDDIFSQFLENKANDITENNETVISEQKDVVIDNDTDNSSDENNEESITDDDSVFDDFINDTNSSDSSNENNISDDDFLSSFLSDPDSLDESDDLDSTESTDIAKDLEESLAQFLKIEKSSIDNSFEEEDETQSEEDIQGSVYDYFEPEFESESKTASLIHFISGDEEKKFISDLFLGDSEKFEKLIEDIDQCATWRKAAKMLDLTLLEFDAIPDSKLVDILREKIQKKFMI